MKLWNWFKAGKEKQSLLPTPQLFTQNCEPSPQRLPPPHPYPGLHPKPLWQDSITRPPPFPVRMEKGVFLFLSLYSVSREKWQQKKRLGIMTSLSSQYHTQQQNWGTREERGIGRLSSIWGGCYHFGVWLSLLQKRLLTIKCRALASHQGFSQASQRSWCHSH